MAADDSSDAAAGIHGWAGGGTVSGVGIVGKVKALLEVGQRPRRVEAAPGDRVNAHAVVDCGVYSGGRRTDRATLAFPAAARRARRHRDGFVWLGLHEPDRATMRAIAATFGLHDLIVRQTVQGGHRPAAETIGEVTRLVLRTARYVEHDQLTATSEVVDTGDVTVLIGPRFVITVRHGAAGALRSVRADLEAMPELLAAGPWAVAYAVGNRMVDEYLTVAEHVEKDLDSLEEAVFAPHGFVGIEQMYQLKREMVEFKRAVLPLQDPLDRLLDQAAPVVRPYLVDLRGRLARAVERVAGFDDLLNSILQARLAQVSIDQNNDMRKIASWAAIAAVQTTIAGMYGMNFASMPGLNSWWGYPGVLTVMALASVVIYRRLKRVGWL